MAGAGYKLFNTGDVLSASDVNTYLMQQTVMSFASSAARTTALASVLAEGMVTYLQDTNVVEIYTGSSWVSLDDPNAIQNSIVDAKGDIIAATADNTPSRLAVGANNTVLTADSSTATGLKWAAIAGGGGKVLQVVNFTNSTQADSTSTSQTTVITATITPSATTSKILVLSNLAGCAMLTSGTNDWGEGNMTRNAGVASWNVADRICQGMFTSGGSQPVGGFTCFTARLDEPASTSVVTYLLRFFRGNGTGTFRINSNNAVSSVTLIEIGA